MVFHGSCILQQETSHLFRTLPKPGMTSSALMTAWSSSARLHNKANTRACADQPSQLSHAANYWQAPYLHSYHFPKKFQEDIRSCPKVGGFPFRRPCNTSLVFFWGVIWGTPIKTPRLTLTHHALIQTLAQLSFEQPCPTSPRASRDLGGASMMTTRSHGSTYPLCAIYFGFNVTPLL